MSVALTVTVTPKGGTAFYTKSITAPDWDHVEDVQMAVAHALKSLGDGKRDHKKKHPKLDLSILPTEVLLVRIDTPEPDVFNLASFKSSIDPAANGRKAVTDSLDKQLSKF